MTPHDHQPQAKLSWRDGVPVADAFDDPYFAQANGLAETRHVFLDGNDLPGRFRDGFHIAELGFGTGFNLIAALLAFRAAGVTGRLHYTGFEAFPMSPSDMGRALAAFPQVAEVAAPITAWWRDPRVALDLPDLRARVILGDAADTLPNWSGTADAWFLDGFAPARNPGMWGADLMRAVADRTAQDGTFATYTAAGHVRRALAEAGFDVERRVGYGRKRHMSVGVLRTASSA